MDGASRLHSGAYEVASHDSQAPGLPRLSLGNRSARSDDQDPDDEERSRLQARDDAEMPHAYDTENGDRQHLRAAGKKIPLRSKHEVAATLLKMDHFADRLASIRSEIANRNSSYPGQVHSLPQQQQQAQRFPPTQATAANIQAESRPGIESFESLKLPLLQLLAANSESAARPADSFLSIDAVQQRAALQQQYTTDAGRLASAEQLAADALQNADLLAEESRIAMIVYTQNERNWSFDERANRYQKVLEAKRLAEIARSDADDQKAVVQRLRSELVNPYGSLRESPRPLTKRQHHVASRTNTGAQEPSDLEASALADFMYVWILAAPSTNLAFTPRVSTSATVLSAEKELSTHVVYYAAASSVNGEENLTLSESDRSQRVIENSPPSTGWISCSSHGVAPVPEVKSVKSSIETWIVSGAGVGHLNGKYILNGVHDNVRKFKSSTGVELFRKRVPVSSSLAQGLHDTPVEKKPRQLNRDIGTPDPSDDAGTTANQSEEAQAEPNSFTPLPSALKAIERDESDFKAMSRIGSWLGANEVKEKYRRRRENETKKKLLSTTRDHSIERVAEDGDHVLIQDAEGRLENSHDIQESRPEASAELCREWVLFMGCSKRHVAQQDGVSVPPQQNRGLGCLKRHYYNSHEEKETMTIWAQDQEARLEQAVLQHIIRREEQIERVQRLCAKCMSKFQQNLVRETEKLAHQIFSELNTVRFLSVKVLEAIEKWRAHARKLGFARFDAHNNNNTGFDHKVPEHKSSTKLPSSDEEIEPPLLGWSASITVSTGRQLFKGSNAFVSRVKRFCRAEDAVGKKEQQIVYLGYFATRMEAERAYEEYATAEAQRLNTTAVHLPRHRNVFRSCGKHFAVESERLGPSVCIECKVKQLASLSSGESGGDEWAPPFFYTPGENYILKMGNDLDFLDSVPPITSLLNDGHGSDDLVFPILGNVFLLPKTPVQDPMLAVFTTCRLARAPRLGISLEKERDSQEIDDETLNRERILAVQKIFLQELQIYRPDLFPESAKVLSSTAQSRCTASDDGQDSRLNEYRLVEALYWDRCAALRITQKRAPLAFRQENIWCRPDAGEWASLAVRGKHQLHFLFELKLALAGKEVQEKRRQILKALRRLLKTPLYWIPTREHFTKLIDEGCAIKGAVVMLEVKSATKYLDKYDLWCCKTLVIQRWYRGVRGRHRARTRLKALRLVCSFRKRFAEQVVSVARSFYQDLVVPQAIKRTIRKIQTPEFSTALRLNGEFVIMSFHSLRFAQHYSLSSPLVQSSSSRRLQRSVCCAGCARRFHVRAEYKAASGRFEVSNGGVCCCSLNGDTSESSGSTESWLVRAYNPTSNTTYRMRMENALVRQLLLSLSPPKFGRLSSLASAPTGQLQASPVALKWAMHERAAIASIQANFYHAQGEKAYQELLNWRLLSNEAIQRRKTAVVHRDRTVTRLESLKRSYLLSIDSAKAALDFTSRRFHEAQAWDPLENANDWKLLVQKRQLQKDLIGIENELDRCRWEVFQATYNEQFLRVRAAQVQDQYENGWLPLVHQKNLQMESASTLETQSKTFVERSMRQICTQFLTLRDGYFLPTRRHLVLQSRTWKERSGVRIALPGLLRCRNVMRRRVLLLSNSGKATSNSRNERTIVEISVSPSPSASAGARSSDDVWVVAYNPTTSFVQEVFLEWELVELLIELKKNKNKDQSLLLDGDQRRSAMLSIADQLLTMAMLDRFTGEFTLRKLQFYHHMRLLRSQFLSSKWFLDLKRGRKCGDGDEILRQAASVDGKLVVAVVFENWGDLTFALYHAATGETYRLTITLSETFRLLSAKPRILRLWVCCVKANNYNPAMLLYLLKYVRFQHYDESSTPVVVFEPQVPSKTALKRFQKAMRIQERRVLLSIKEDAGGDFAVDAFDWRQNHNYRFVLEREQVRRLLHRSAAPPSPSYRYLMLHKNRTELYEWIASRLTFQSLLEHPQLLAASHSPLVFGAHLRESFSIFNQWVSSSVRNPLRCVAAEELNQWAAAVDTAAFSQLQFDQLALIADAVTPFDYDKEALGTLDWILHQSSPAPSVAREKDSPFMKMDFFVKNHNLFVRLRKELELETQTRLERTSRGALEAQEKLSLWVEIQCALESTLQLFSNWQQCAERARGVVEERIIVLGQLHRELAIRSKVDDVSQVQSRDAEKCASDLLFGDDDEDDGSATVDFRELFGECLLAKNVDFVTKVVGLSSGALAVASRFLSKCWYHVENTLKPALAKLDGSVKRTAQQQQPSHRGVPLETLKEIWREVLRFQSSSIVHDFTIDDLAQDHPVSQTPDWTSVPTSFAVTKSSSAHNESLESKSCEPVALFETGILIPSQCDEPMQELFLGGTSVCVTNLAELLKPLIGHTGNTRSKPRDNIAIQVKPMHEGILAYQTTTSIVIAEETRGAKLDWNPRASAIAMDASTRIVGAALYYPTHKTDRSFLERLERITTLYRGLALASDPSLSSNNLQQVVRRKQLGNRVKQQLPWKVFAGERLQAARSLKRMRAAEQLALNPIDATIKSVESRTLATLPVEFRELELFFGDCFSVNRLKLLLQTEVESLLVSHKASSYDSSSQNEWTLSVAKPLSMRNALVPLLADGANSTAEGALSASSGLRLEHLQVEVDSLEQPRRLIFSCRELQSQRKYYLDCSYHELQTLLSCHATNCVTKSYSIPSSTASILSIADWRRFAQQAAQLLVFRKNNGALGLAFRPGGSSAEVDIGDNDDASMPISATVAPVAISMCSTEHQLNLKSSMTSCLQRRFEKHQVAIRTRACEGLLTSQRAQLTAQRLGSEWMRMTKEDLAAHECRGLLVLDQKQLKKLQTALTAATKRVRALVSKSSADPNSSNTNRLMGPQLMEFVREMGLAELVNAAALESVILATREAAQRLKRKRTPPPAHDTADTLSSPVELKEVAEWWRRHQLKPKEA